MKKLTTFKPEFIEKRWGGELWIANDSCHDYCGKILYIKSGHSTSMHFHQKKHETFYILEGALDIEIIDTITTDKYVKTINEGEVFVLDRLMPHRLVPKGGDVKFVEISTFHEDSDSYRVYRELPQQLSIT